MTHPFHPFRRRKLAGATAIALVGSSLALVAGTTTAARAASSDGALTVRVVRDFGGTGTYNPIIDGVLSGVTVKVSDPFGAAVTLTSDATGTVTIPAGDTRLSGGKYRVDVTNPLPGTFYPAPAQTDPAKPTPSATDISPNTEFVDVSGGKSVTDTTAFWRPRDYCQSNPKVANACQNGIYNHGAPAGSDVDTSSRDTLFLTNYNDSNYQNLAKTVAGSANGVGTGSLFGIAYNRQSKLIYSAAYAKRDVAYGDAGAGGIYVTDPATGITKIFTTVPNVGPNGSNTPTPHEFLTAAAGGKEDFAFRVAVGKESLGAIVMSDDYKSFFVINMGDKKVYQYDATQAAASAPIRTIDVSGNQCGPGTTDNDWRPTGLGEQDGTVYVGGICTGEDEASVTNVEPATMKALVLSFDETAASPSPTVVMSAPLNFTRAGQSAAQACVAAPFGASWKAWNDNMWCQSPASGAPTVNQEDATPMLNKIVVEANGDLDLSFRDRGGDQYGRGLYANSVGSTTEIHPEVMTAASLNRACLADSAAPISATNQYVLDSLGGCGIAAVPAGTVVNTYYNQPGFSPHLYSAFAGMTRSRAELGLVTDNMDAAGEIVTNGISVRDNATGGVVNGQTVRGASGQWGFGTNATAGTNFGKGAGLADMDVLCDFAPIQIGNHVWYNTAADGTEHAGEAPVVGATVKLYNSAGVVIGTTTTDANGNYYFDSRTTAGLLPNEKYSVKMDNPADYAAGGPLDKSKWNLTAPGENKGTMVGDYPSIPVSTGDHGATDHTFDFGFKPIPKIHIVKYDGRLAASPHDPATAHDNNVSKPVVYKAGSNGTTGRQPVAMIGTNTGSAVLGDITVSDTTIAAPKMTGLTCDFSKLGGPSSGTFWKGQLKPGDSFPCIGYVDLVAGQTHADQINISGVQLDPVTGGRVAGVAPVKDFDRYYAKTSYTSKLAIDKYDAKTGNEADTASTAQRLKSGETRKIAMPATNTGTSPLTRVTIWDTTLGGPKMQNLTCTMPDGSVARANAAGAVVWAASFWKAPHKWLPGQHIFCTGTLTMQSGAPMHGDQINVKATDPSGKLLGARNRFYATVPSAPAHTGL